MLGLCAFTRTYGRQPGQARLSVHVTTSVGDCYASTIKRVCHHISGCLCRRSLCTIYIKYDGVCPDRAVTTSVGDCYASSIKHACHHISNCYVSTIKRVCHHIGG